MDQAKYILTIKCPVLFKGGVLTHCSGMLSGCRRFEMLFCV